MPSRQFTLKGIYCWGLGLRGLDGDPRRARSTAAKRNTQTATRLLLGSWGSRNESLEPSPMGTVPSGDSDASRNTLESPLSLTHCHLQVARGSTCLGEARVMNP